MAEDLVAWLRACLDEDEDIAKRAGFGWGPSWVEETVDDWSYVHADGKRDMVGSEDHDVTTHIARHDPASVLADVAAKRALIDLHDVGEATDAAMNEYPWCGECGLTGPCRTLRVLATAYAGRPGWQEEWRG